MTGIMMAVLGGAGGPTIPVNTVAPVVTGTAQVGQTLSCTTGTWTGKAPITYTYQWQYGAGNTNISGETSSTYVIQSAYVGQTIRCLVTATNSIGAVSAPSNSTSAVSATVPTAPTVGTVNYATATSLTVDYTASSSDGGSTITSYTAVSSPGNITGSISTSGSGTITVSGLTKGQAYTFVVYATNASGNSPNSASSASKIASTVPGAPTIGTATATSSSQISVTFTAPADNGGQAITSYTVTSSGGQTGTGSNSPITVSGLTPGTAYTFTVKATNPVGTGASSAASNSATPSVGLSWTYSNQLSTTSYGTAYTTGGATSSTTFVILGSNLGKCATSTDGLTWTYRAGLNSAGFLANYPAVAWNGSVFCAVGWQNYTGICATSPDGVTWTIRTSFATAIGATGNMALGITNPIVWTGSVFYALIQGDNGGSGAYKAATSPDGITWTAKSSPGTSVYGAGVAGGGAILLGTGIGIYRSTNSGTSFSNVSSFSIARTLPYNGTAVVAMGSSYTVRSTDNGATWSATIAIPSSPGNDYGAAAGATIIDGANSGYGYISTDNGASYTSITAKLTAAGWGTTPTYVPIGRSNRVVLVGDSGKTVVSS